MLESVNKRAARRYFPPSGAESVFVQIASHRTLCAAHVHAFMGDDLSGGKTLRNTRLRIQTWESHGYLSRLVVPDRPPTRFYFLTRAAYQYWPQLSVLASKHVYQPPKPELAIHAWHRASLALALRAEGYTVGRDLSALIALRRFLIDSQLARIEQASGNRRDELQQGLHALRNYALLQPWVVYSCEECDAELPIGSARPTRCQECGGTFGVHVVHQPYECGVCHKRAEVGGPHLSVRGTCSGTLRLVDYLPFDLAYKKGAAGYDVKVLLADHPYRSIASQLADLPLRVMGQAKVDVIVRPCEDGSVFHKKRQTFAIRGPRYRQYLRAFSAEDAKSDAFPYWMTARLLPENLYPNTHFRVLREA